ncbi:MAG: 4Fe-4S binding protein [Candidatus Marinimicrobia bacterium]|nr:4Fe-4S binding protein [Candidatus Neomarinimicrobiota bacterium]
MRKNFLHNKTKLIIQGGILVLLVVLLFLGYRGTDLEAYCPFGGLLSLGSKLWLGSMSCNMGAQQVFMGLALALAVILFSKLFCGYVCPLGTITEWLNKVYSRFGNSMILRGIWDRILRLGKYLLLFFTAYFTLTSSELWCKNFDPYYAAVSGFDADVVVWAGILTIFTVVFLSVFIRFFWCKYACPLGALSNIFQNFWLFVPIIVVYVILTLVGVKINILWLILALTLMGAAVEIFRFKFYSISPFNIKVNHSNCSSCGLCDKNCPVGINVSQYKTVTHPDCTLCMDCVKGCPEPGGIQLDNTKSRSTWLPPVALIVLFFVGLLLSKQITFTTLSERWGGFENLDRVETFEMAGLKSVKCWGSSKSLQNQLVRKKGIVGLDTWANQNRIMVYYNPQILDEQGVKKTIFNPSKYRLREYAAEETPETVTIFQVPVEGLFDTYDNYDLIRMLKSESAICGMATSFGEPVDVKVVYKTGAISPQKIIEIIEQDSYVKETSQGQEIVEVEFDCASQGKILDTLAYLSFIKEYFKAYNRKFNNYNDVPTDSLYIYEIGMPGADNSSIHRRLGLLSSHLSFNDDIVRIQTLYNKRPVLRIYYKKGKVEKNELYNKLVAPKLTVMLRSGKTKEFNNTFKFEKPATVFPVSD